VTDKTPQELRHEALKGVAVGRNRAWVLSAGIDNHIKLKHGSYIGHVDQFRYKSIKSGDVLSVNLSMRRPMSITWNGVEANLFRNLPADPLHVVMISQVKRLAVLQQ